MLTQMDPNSREYAIEKIRWVTAHEYAMQYGMSIVGAFVAVVVSSINPEQVYFQIDIKQFEEARATKPVEERWLFDMESIEGLEMLFRGRLNVSYPEGALFHMFPSYIDCDKMLKMAIEASQQN